MENEGPERAEPEKARAEADPQEGARPSGPARKPGEAYFPPPEAAPAPERRRWWPAAVLALALAGGAALLKSRPVPSTAGGAPPGAAAAGAVKQEKLFLVSMKDLDEARTAKARALLKAGLPASARHPGAAALPAGSLEALPAGSGAPAKAPEKAPAPTQAGAPQTGLAEELAAMPQPIQDQLRDGSMSLFTFRFIDFVAEDGDVVDVAVDGQIVGRVTLSNAGAELSIPLRPKEQHVITITAVYDGGGGVTFGAVSSVGELRTRVMAPGETESWTVGFQGSAAAQELDGFLNKKVDPLR